jgi:hypothetical protein
MISLTLRDKDGKPIKKIGLFKSYRAIGEYLVKHGEVGKYYAMAKNIKSLAGIKEISVNKRWFDEDLQEWDAEVEMEGSYY